MKPEYIEHNFRPTRFIWTLGVDGHLAKTLAQPIYEGDGKIYIRFGTFDGSPRRWSARRHVRGQICFGYGQSPAEAFEALREAEYNALKHQIHERWEAGLDMKQTWYSYDRELGEIPKALAFIALGITIGAICTFLFG